MWRMLQTCIQRYREMEKGERYRMPKDGKMKCCQDTNSPKITLQIQYSSIQKIKEVGPTWEIILQHIRKNKFLSIDEIFWKKLFDQWGTLDPPSNKT